MRERAGGAAPRRDRPGNGRRRHRLTGLSVPLFSVAFRRSRRAGQSRHRLCIGALIGMLAIVFLSSLARAQTGCGVPSAGSDRWPVAAPQSVGLSGATLRQMVTLVRESKPRNVHAILVVRHGALVFEHYFSGSDELLGRAVGELHDERSVTKSVVALVLQNAIERGLIASIDEPVFSFSGVCGAAGAGKGSDHAVASPDPCRLVL